MARKYIRGGIVVIGVALVAGGVFVFRNLPGAEPPISERANALNDAGEFHLTTIERVIPVHNEGDVTAAIRYAREHHRKIAIAGRRHSMGGHSLYPDGVVLDMTPFRAIKTFDPEQNLLVVESGATWSDIQEYLNPLGHAVIAMQGPNIFTVGGSISVNAHGWDKNTPTVADTVEWLRIALADGTIKRCSLQENFELFHLVLGGYGLFGVILDVGLRVTENHLLQPHYSILPSQALRTHLEGQVFNNERVELVYADLAIAPDTLFDEVIISHFERVNEGDDSPVVPLQEEKYELRDRLFLNLSRKYQWGKSLRWALYKALQLPNSLLTRNNLMRAPFQRLRYYSPEDVDILQEYFIPREYAIQFIDSVRTIVKRHNANLLNCTVRIVNRSSKTFLNYAKQDSFAFVLYFNVRKDESGKSMDRTMTRELIDTTLSYGGTFYLPYLPYYDREQLRAAYPEIDSFFAAKKHYDPDELFTNYFYDRYALNRISLSP